MRRRPWLIFHYARRSAALHAEMHGSKVQADIPHQRSKLAWKIRRAVGLPEVLKLKTLSAVLAMPGGDRLCHGDFHPGNILVTAQGECVIDWIDAAIGNPLADLARTTIILQGGADCQEANPLVKAFSRIFHRVYISSYFNLQPGGEGEYQRWLPIVAAARLSEGIPELQDWLVRQAAGGKGI